MKSLMRRREILVSTAGLGLACSGLSALAQSPGDLVQAVSVGVGFHDRGNAGGVVVLTHHLQVVA